MNLKPIARNSLVDMVVERIRRVIEEGQLAAGHRLPSESELVDRLQVSRPVLREAIGRLESLGLVSVRRGLGTFVGDRSGLSSCVKLVKSALTISPRELLQFAEFRGTIECHAARRAAELATAADIVELESLCRKMDVQADREAENIRLDFDFHRKLVEIAGNELMLNVMEVLRQFIVAGMRETIPKPNERAESRGFHREICQAVAVHDPDAAEAAMRAHMAAVRRRLLLAEQGQSPNQEPALTA